MNASFSLPDAMAVGLSKLLSKSKECAAFVAMADKGRVYYAGIIDGELRWYESSEEDVSKDEFMARSWVIPWSALPLCQQTMIAFSIKGWMDNQARMFLLKELLLA
jgi:hypothetical protein